MCSVSKGLQRSETALLRSRWKKLNYMESAYKFGSENDRYTWTEVTLTGSYGYVQSGTTVLNTTRPPVFRWKARGYDWILVDSIGQPSPIPALLRFPRLREGNWPMLQIAWPAAGFPHVLRHRGITMESAVICSVFLWTKTLQCMDSAYLAVKITATQ